MAEGLLVIQDLVDRWMEGWDRDECAQFALEFERLATMMELKVYDARESANSLPGQDEIIAVAIERPAATPEGKPAYTYIAKKFQNQLRPIPGEKGLGASSTKSRRKAGEPGALTPRDSGGRLCPSARGLRRSTREYVHPPTPTSQGLRRG